MYHNATFCQNWSSSFQDITIFLNFARWRPLSSWICKIVTFYWLLGSGAPICIIAAKFGQNRSIHRKDIAIFQDGGSAILDLFGVYLDITVQNLDVIDAVVSIIGKFQYLVHMQNTQKANLCVNPRHLSHQT